MALQMTAELVGVKKFARAWDSLLHHFGDDLRPLFKVVETWWFNEQSHIFDSEGRRLNGGRWKSLKPEYREWKQSNFPNMPILQLTGNLKRGMTGRSGRHSASDLQHKEMTIWLKAIPYWGVHNFGYKPKNIPKRPYIGASNKMLRTLDQDMQKKLKELERDAFGSGAGFVKGK